MMNSHRLFIVLPVPLTYGTGINICSCKNSNCINQHHGHILTGNLRIIENDKHRKIISNRPNYKKPKTINTDQQSNLIEFVISLLDKM